LGGPASLEQPDRCQQLPASSTDAPSLLTVPRRASGKCEHARVLASTLTLSLPLTPGQSASFGRRHEHQLPIGVDPVDPWVSRDAGRLHSEGRWFVENTGSRAFFLVEPGGEVEVFPPGRGRSVVSIDHGDSWIRVPGTTSDHAIVLDVPPEERPLVVLPPPDEASASAGTMVEGAVSLTANELRSVVAVYEQFLLLPPHYRREPKSFRAAAHRIGVEEGKVKADLRRVQQKVQGAGGPADGGPRYRDALISWLMARTVVRRQDVALLDHR